VQRGVQIARGAAHGDYLDEVELYCTPFQCSVFYPKDTRTSTSADVDRDS
jgi:hypothetical protein